MPDKVSHFGRDRKAVACCRSAKNALNSPKHVASAAPAGFRACLGKSVSPNMPQPVSSSRVHLRLSALALIASIVVLVGGYLFLAASGGVFASTAPLEFKPEDAIVIRGESLQRGVLWAPTADADGVLIIRLTDRPIESSLFPTLHIAALADTPPIAVRLLWRQADGEKTTFAKSIAWRNGGRERFALAGDASWGGRVAGLALAFKLQPKAGVLFRSATLQPDTGLTVLSQIAGEWLDLEPWGQHSVNYLDGGAPNPRLPMVPAVFAIAALAFWIYRLLAKRKGLAPSLAVGVIFAMGAWVVVDTRWQYNLLSNLDLTAEKYAGKSLDEKHRAAEDANIYRVAETIRKGLPVGVTKVTLVSDLADSELFLGKLRYYLFPLWLQPKPDPLDPEAVLAVVESPGSVIDPATGTLRLDSGRTLNVVMLVDDPMVRLVRVR
jgi:hypothetical protein